MVKVKIFTDNSLFALEDRINEWFRNNTHINYRDIKYNIECDDYHTVIIIYMIENNS